MKQKVIFLLFLLCASTAHAGVGSIDKREYVDWNTAPYNSIVDFYPAPNYTCTAQYVYHDIILTARHCVTSNNSDDHNAKLNAEYQIELPDGRKTKVKLEKYGRYNKRDDWALLRVTDPNFYSAHYFNVHNDTKLLAVTNAGFGYMRILTDEEIRKIKGIFTTFLNNPENKNSRFDDTLEAVTKEIGNAGIPPLNDYDRESQNRRHRYKLKADKTCQLKEERSYDDTISTSCDNWGGNSGGAYFANNTLYGIVSKGVDSWEDNKNTDYAVSPKKYYSALQEMKRKSPSPSTRPQASQTIITSAAAEKPASTSQTHQNNQTTTIPATTNSATTNSAPQQQKQPFIQTSAKPQEVNDIISSVTEPNNETAEAEIQQQEQLLNQTADNLNENVQNIPSMSDENFLTLLSKITEYQVLKENLERAREREMSTANKLLGGAAIGATGIGGMMLASGLAEQQADEEAEQAMRAYLATFHCNYGGGINVKGGEKDVQLPGGNELIDLYTEYVNLANNLKTRKAALDMPPGIESETILDSATSGLYDDVAIGKTSGAFTSLARALQDPESEDAKAWDAQKQDSAKKTKTGGTVAGVGAIGGAVGNLIINKNTETPKTQEQTTSPKQ